MQEETPQRMSSVDAWVRQMWNRNASQATFEWWLPHLEQYDFDALEDMASSSNSKLISIFPILWTVRMLQEA